MIGRVRTFSDTVSHIDDGIDRVWSDPTAINSPIDLAPFGTSSVVILRQWARDMSESDKTRWLASLGAYILRGGEVRWSPR